MKIKNSRKNASEMHCAVAWCLTLPRFFKQVIPSFSFVLNKVFVAARKHNTKRNKTGFILYACDSPPLNSRVEKINKFEFLF